MNAAPLYMTDAAGTDHRIALIHRQPDGCFRVEPEVDDFPRLLLGEAGNGFYDGLPWFLADQMPSGFLGERTTAWLAGRDPFYPADPRDWRDDHLWRYLLEEGGDLPGCFKLGERFAGLSPSTEPTPETEYPQRLKQGCAERKRLPGSVFDGVQPKFALYHPERGHLLVKSAWPEQDADLPRWHDILITEHLANQTLGLFGIESADTRLVSVDDRLFLESARFDRIDRAGRRCMVTLLMADAEFGGIARRWPETMARLHSHGLVTAEAVATTDLLWRFGRLIANYDMHPRNLSLTLRADGEGFELLPVYDMCAMGFKPGEPGGLPSPRCVGSDPAERQALELAAHFWTSLAAHELVTGEVRRQAVMNGDNCGEMMAKFR